MRVLITGGAGFVGSSLAVAFKREQPEATVVALDNLKRRGSELNVALFKEHGIEFVYGDIRSPGDLQDLNGEFDLFIEASAEPSVLAGLDGSPNYVLQTNLVGTLNCLEFARRRAARLVFLSTSRVYSIKPLKEIQLTETPARFEIADAQKWSGISAEGIAENFPVHLPRSLYGASKLASEMIIQEYVDTYGMRAVINRCGVIAGAGQFGKVDQGVFTLWVANHYFGKPLRYTGFGGRGQQVRDLLHPSDLYALIKRQVAQIDSCAGGIFNVGGGRSVSTSLAELTAVCQQLLGREVPIERDDRTSPVDIPLYISDHRRATEAFDWRPARSVENIVEDIIRWLSENEAQLRPIFA
ncbi:MAG TPA: NAD-dependent epimerase/dehydratase family protein [Pyrinomonadaceae bacterium]|nr:NAD-dependent epimerase/dehydratase family protein [Pyrinomonadaceae bacterium]